MEQSRRSYRAAAEIQRRPVQYGRAPVPATAVPASQPVMPASTAPAPMVAVELRLHWPSFRRLRAGWSRVFTARRRQRLHRVFSNAYVRTTLIGMALIVVAGQVYPLVQDRLAHHSYDLGSAASLLQAKDAFLGKSLVYSQKDGSYNYNQNYSPTGQDDAVTQGGAVIKASANADASKGLTVTDPVNQIDFKLSPQFPTLAAKQDANRLIYPLQDGTGWMVYTMQASGVKEDILLSHANGDVMKLSYKMDLSSQGLAARLQPDGSVGIFGSSLPITGNVTTSDAKDAALLQKARQNAKKDKLLFSLPTPVVYQANNVVSKAAKTHYELKGDTITTVTTGLRHATFPLTVDPAVTVTSTADLFRDTTPESNIDLNATTGNVARGQVTGGLLPAWSSSPNNLNTARFLSGGVIYDDYLYAAGGTDNTGTNFTSVEYAHINSGSSATGTWSTTTSLPVGLSHFVLAAYNGYLYAIGGAKPDATSDTSCGTDSNNVYYIRIQSNGSLSGSWNTATGTLPTAACDIMAGVYQGKMYVAGGRTSKNQTSGLSTTGYATILPNGDVGTFTTSSVSLPANRYAGDMRIYNGYIYLIGGAIGNGGSTTNTVIYDAIASDGSFYGSSSAAWLSASSFTTARGNSGSSFTMAYDGYMYIVGGCSVYASTQNCSTQLGDVQIAQINADGTLGTWANDAAANISSTLVAPALASWRGNVYVWGGCSLMAGGSVVACADNTTHLFSAVNYSTIAIPGQVGPLITTPTNMPAALFGHEATVLNGYMYVAGGCITNSCGGASATTGNVSYAQINADGSVGSWTTDSTHTLNGTNGLAFFGFTSYNGVLYAVGGYSTSGAGGASDSNSIYYLQPNANGSLPGSWNNAPSPKLSAARHGLSAVAYHGFLFAFGGCTTAGTTVACNTYSSTVDRFTLNAINGSLVSGTTVTALPTATAFMGTAFYNGYVYLAGGQTGTSTYASSILYANITSAGGLASWSATTATLMNPGSPASSDTIAFTSAYANNGYLYVTGGYDASSVLSSVESGQITMSSGDIASMSVASTTISARWGAATVFENGFIYILGGCTAGGAPTACSARSTLDESVEQYYASNKNTSAWTTAANTYTTNRVQPASTVYNGYIYIAGGCGTAYSVVGFTGGCASGNELATVYYAALNPDGSIGTWNNASGYNLPAARAAGCLVTAGGYLYYLGGWDATSTASGTVYYNQIGANGLPGSWNTATGGIGDSGSGVQARISPSCAVFNSYIYVTGGLNGSGAAQTTVYHSPSLASGGDISKTWVSSTAFTTARENHTALAAGGYLYVMGGDDRSNALSDVQYIQLDPSTGNTTGSWAYTTDLPAAASGMAAFAANGYIYLIGGRTAAATCLATTQVASINSTGTLSQWNQSVNNLSAARFGMGAAFYNGYYYSLGGDNCTSIISSAVIQQGGMRSQAMKGSFSKYADLNGDGRPEKLVIYLTNAQNNGVDIEKWSMVYKSSREAANSWGVNTTVNPLIDQNAYQVYAYDGSGTDQVIARYFQMTFSINQEQSFTFVDNPTARPTIYQYGLHYAPPPSKRLMHGRDFRDQNQQGEDLKLGI